MNDVRSCHLINKISQREFNKVANKKMLLLPIFLGCIIYVTNLIKEWNLITDNHHSNELINWFVKFIFLKDVKLSHFCSLWNMTCNDFFHDFLSKNILNFYFIVLFWISTLALKYFTLDFIEALNFYLFFIQK